MRSHFNRLALLAALLLVPLGFGSNAGEPPKTDHGHDATVRHRFDDVDYWSSVFDDPKRDTWQKPEVVIRFLGVTAGQKVADLGAGTGYFSVRLAKAVGATGRVYAVEIEPNLVEHIRERAEESGLGQLTAVLATPDDAKLPPGQIDLVLICDTWHHIDDRIRYLQRLARALRPSGRIAVVDYKEGELPVGPPPAHKLSEKAVAEEFAGAGWTLESRYDALPYQYVLVFSTREEHEIGIQRKP
jgi:ubiquinone/menaquinone biosynthesis C-methylase UbiE